MVVPVIRNADALDFPTFRAKYEEFVGAARENKLGADDLQGASFTLTNPGGIGTIASVPRLMVGQGAIIAIGAIGYPAGFATANEQSLRLLGVSRVMQMTSTYDHRVIQGAQSGEYLRRVDELLQGRDGFYEAIFASLGLQAAPVPEVSLAPVAGAAPARPSDEMLRAVAAGMAIVSAYRRHGHLAAHLDPLGTAPVGDASLEPQTYGLTPALQSAIPAGVLRVKVPGQYARRRAAAPQGDVQLDDRVRNRAHLQREPARLVARLHRVGAQQGQAISAAPIEFLERFTQVEAFDQYIRKTFLARRLSRAKVSTSWCRCSKKCSTCSPMMASATRFSAWRIADALT